MKTRLGEIPYSGGLPLCKAYRTLFANGLTPGFSAMAYVPR